MSKATHEYHLVDPSAMPILGAISLLTVATGAIMFMHGDPYGAQILIVGFAALIALLFKWWRSVIREGAKDKAHTEVVQKGLRLGMKLFIASEVMFFFGFFFSFFKSSLYPVDIFMDETWPVMAGMWPPEGIVTFDPWGIPFLNTIILLVSSFTASIAHHAIQNKKIDNAKIVRWLTITVILGITFTGFQAYEYYHAAFGFTGVEDHPMASVYASNFYMATGFHGFHVLIGTIFLITCLMRARKKQLTAKGHLGLEFACWYWHFVDVVWIFLFTFVYVWGG